MLLSVIIVYLAFVLGCDALCKKGGEVNHSLATTVAQSSYTCDDAIEIRLGAIPFDNTGAPDQPVSICSTTNHIIWFKWTATFSGFLQLSTCQSTDYYSLIVMYTDCANFPSTSPICTTVRCEGDSYGANLVAQVEEGQAYYIAVGGNRQSSGPGTLKLSQAKMDLTLLTPAIPTAGGDISFIISSDSAESFSAAITVTCTTGSYLSGNVYYTSSETRQKSISGRSPGICTLAVTSGFENALTSTSVFYVADPLTLELPTTGNTLFNGSPFSILATTDNPSINEATSVTFTCGKESETIQVTANAVKVDAVFTNPNLLGDCIVMAVTEPVAYATYSFTSVTILSPLVLKVMGSSSSFAAGSEIYYSLSLDGSFTDPIRLRLFCEGVEVQSVPTTVSTATQLFVIDGQAKGRCTLQAFRADNDDAISNSVAITVYQQLVLASSLQGWTGGQSVSVLLTSPEGLSFSTELVTTCSIGSYSQSVITASTEEYTLPSTLNGIDCLLSTPGSLPDYYLPLQQTLVRIAMSEATSQSVIQAVCPASFVRIGEM